MIIGGVVTTGKLLKDDPAKASRFIRATLKGLNFYKADKSKSLLHDGILENSGQPFSRDKLRLSPRYVN